MFGPPLVNKLTPPPLADPPPVPPSPPLKLPQQYCGPLPPDACRKSANADVPPVCVNYKVLH